MKIASDFDIKIDYFYNSLQQRIGTGKKQNKIRLNLRRSNLLSDAFDRLLTADPESLQKHQLVVNFEGEEGFVTRSLTKFVVLGWIMEGCRKRCFT